MSFKKAIVLVGKGNSGKTTTIKKLIKTLLEDRNFLAIDNRGRTNQEISSCLKIDQQKENGDLMDETLLLKHLPSKCLVGITSRGDSTEQLESSMRLFNKNNCAFIICASHETDTMFNFINTKTQHMESFYSYKPALFKTDGQQDKTILNMIETLKGWLTE